MTVHNSLKRVTTKNNITSVDFTGDDGANIVQISDVLTDAKVFEGDFGSDSANDQLIFNVDDILTTPLTLVVQS